MRKLVMILMITLLLFSGCSWNKFEPYVYQQIDVIEVNDSTDPILFLRDVENAGLVFEVIQSDLDITTPGTYQITYRISLDKKQTERTYTIKVRDEVPPVIKGNERIEIPYGGTFSLKDYISAIDEMDGDVSNSLHYEGSINAYEEGRYPIIVYAEDQFGNQAEREIIVDVVKREYMEPTIVGTYTDTDYRNGQQPTLTLYEDNTFEIYLNGCSVVKLISGTYKQYMDVLYLVANNHGFSLVEEENIVHFIIEIDGSLRFDSVLELCAPSYGDIFIKEE